MDSHDRTVSNSDCEIRRPTPRVTVVITCRVCGVVFNVFPSRQDRNRRVCSLRCRRLLNADSESLRQRFWSRVAISKPTDCWKWQASFHRKGYGIFWLPYNRRIFAHRFAYSLTHGPISDGLWVLHRCDNPPCVNPAHLFLGTVQDNSADMVRKQRQAYAERNSQHKLTVTEVAAIRAQYIPFVVTRRKLAAAYGVSRHTIDLILNRTAWRLI